MNTLSPKIDAWLYVSRFMQTESWTAIETMSREFSVANLSRGITGFLISDGNLVMQYIEGGESELAQLKSNIFRDIRHTDIITHNYTSVSERAYPDWSLKAVKPGDYELLFSKIDAAHRDSLGVSIARMLFDATFEA